MNFSIERPAAFYALLIMIPALAFSIKKYAALIKTMTERNAVQRDTADFAKVKRRFFLRTLFRCLSWCTLCCALAGISWGVNTVPVQKSGRAVSFVFDISYSMEAHDTPNGDSRLENAAAFADRLLDQLPGTSVSVVLSKGDAVVAIPLTEDRESVKILLTELSPDLLTAEGTSLGSGIEAAIKSFPVQSAETSYIWVFTDGEETDEALVPALNDAVKYGIPVAVIGFGSSSRETEVLTGDGVTRTSTSLREKAILKDIETVQKKNASGKVSYANPGVIYVNSAENSSGYRLLKMLNADVSSSGETQLPAAETTNIAFEVQSISRKNIFILLTIIFFVLSFVAGELDFSSKKMMKASAAAGMLVSVFMFTGCSERVSDGKKILEGRLEWNRKDYQEAVADFLEASEDAVERGDQDCQNYAVYGLASTYLMQGETDAAMERFSQISANAPDSVKFSVLYNSGIIAHRKGDYTAAAEYFKEALRINPEDTNAKINLELSLQGDNVKTNTQEQQRESVTENNDEESYDDVIYSVIRENEQEQWKNRQQKSERSARDY